MYRPVVLGLGRLVEEIPPFLDVRRLFRVLFWIPPRAQHHVEPGPVKRVVPSVAGRRFEYAISVGIRCPARLAHGWIACAPLAGRDLIAVNGIVAVTDTKLANGLERSFVTDLDRAGVVGRSRHGVVEHHRRAAGDEDEPLGPVHLQALGGERVVVYLGALASVCPRADPVDFQLAVDDPVVPDHDPRPVVGHDPRVVAVRVHDRRAEASLIVLEVDRLGSAHRERPAEGDLAGSLTVDRLSQAILLQGVKVAVVHAEVLAVSADHDLAGPGSRVGKPGSVESDPGDPEGFSFYPI